MTEQIQTATQADRQMAQNAAHAAATWLSRIGASPNAVAVATVSPRAAVGLWEPGRASVAMLPDIDDAGAELCEAVAPFVQSALERMTTAVRAATLNAAVHGARLQVLVSPDDIALRLVHDDRQATLCVMSMESTEH